MSWLLTGPNTNSFGSFLRDIALGLPLWQYRKMECIPFFYSYLSWHMSKWRATQCVVKLVYVYLSPPLPGLKRKEIQTVKIPWVCTLPLCFQQKLYIKKWDSALRVISAFVSERTCRTTQGCLEDLEGRDLADFRDLPPPSRLPPPATLWQPWEKSRGLQLASGPYSWVIQRWGWLSNLQLSYNIQVMLIFPSLFTSYTIKHLYWCLLLPHQRLRNFCGRAG